MIFIKKAINKIDSFSEKDKQYFYNLIDDCLNKNYGIQKTLKIVLGEMSVYIPENFTFNCQEVKNI